MKISIRPATKSDMPRIHQLVLELAKYENEPQAVTVRISDYEEAFEKGAFEVLLATDNEQIVGMAFYYDTYSTWKGKMVYLEDFVVTKSYRRSGCGQLLFDAFIDAAREKKAKLVKWQVLDWNEPALNFYKKNQAIIEKEWWNGKIFLEEC